MHTHRIPFRLHSNQEFTDLQAPLERLYETLTLRMTSQSGLYVVTAKEFRDEAEAQSFVPRIVAGLGWAAIELGVATSYSRQSQTISYEADAGAVFDGSTPAIYLTERRALAVTGQHVTLKAGFDAGRTFDTILSAMRLPNSHRVPEDQKLLVALQLYVSFFHESSEASRFLALCMSLEALAPAQLKPVYAHALIQRWVTEIQALKSGVARESEEWAVYDSLEKEIAFRKEVSIRKKIRSVVLGELRATGAADATPMARRAVECYDLRSTLVHNGTLPIAELRRAADDMREIVRRVLRARFVTIAS
jgi:hypothetical protein